MCTGLGLAKRDMKNRIFFSAGRVHRTSDMEAPCVTFQTFAARRLRPECPGSRSLISDFYVMLSGLGLKKNT